MIDAQHDNSALVVVDLIHDSVRAPSGRVQPGEFALQPPAGSIRVVDQRGQHEFDDRGCRALGEPFELTLSRPGDPKLVPRVRLAQLGAKRFRSWSPVTKSPSW